MEDASHRLALWVRPGRVATFVTDDDLWRPEARRMLEATRVASPCSRGGSGEVEAFRPGDDRLPLRAEATTPLVDFVIAKILTQGGVNPCAVVSTTRAISELSSYETNTPMHLGLSIFERGPKFSR